MSTFPAADSAAPLPDPLFPSGYFAKVPAEVFASLALPHAGGMSHAEFRVFVALCRFRGPSRQVHPTRMTLEAMTGMTPNNISRCTKGLKDKGWLIIHYQEGKDGSTKKRLVGNYELRLPEPNRAVKSQPRTPAKKAIPTALPQQSLPKLTYYSAPDYDYDYDYEDHDVDGGDPYSYCMPEEVIDREMAAKLSEE